MARCKEEPSLLLKLSDPNKPLDKAINYLCNVIQKMGVCMVDYNTVLGLLSHFYDGDADEEDIKKVNCNIVVSNSSAQQSATHSSKPQDSLTTTSTPAIVRIIYNIHTFNPL